MRIRKGGEYKTDTQKATPLAQLLTQNVHRVEDQPRIREDGDESNYLRGEKNAYTIQLTRGKKEKEQRSEEVV